MDIQTVIPLCDQLKALGVDWELTIRKGDARRLWVTSVKQESELYRPVLTALTSFFSKLEKEISYGQQSWSAEKDGLSLTMYGVAKCKVVGYKTVEKKKVIEVETEEIETDEEPIYDCTETA